ncbi:TIGR02147 family protein [Bdellovibrio sp. HCB337]|uniref:TIGR02147 family protein n=1 Tax=Bdellovibrio sp. HCB337 TaxID=3394358 RepID=UPI0039A4F59E
MKTIDFKTLLRQELEDRCKRNPSYSLRAFATQLEIDASTLSKILKGKRPLGPQMIKKLGARIGMSTKEVSVFSRLADKSADAAAEQMTFEQITYDRFAVISDWYHFAILELMQIKDFRTDPAWIAKALGMQRSEVSAAIERLQRVGLLKVNDNGTWDDVSGGNTTSIGPEMMSTAHRRLQQQFLEKASESLVQVPIQERDHSTMTMAVDRSRLPAAREKIKRFRRSLAKFLTEGDVRDEVLNLNIALFPITKLHERKNV